MFKNARAVLARKTVKIVKQVHQKIKFEYSI